jgi:hypothetical protein
MTAPPIKRNAAKKPLISGRRPDMTMPFGGLEQLRLKTLLKTWPSFNTILHSHGSCTGSGHVQILQLTVPIPEMAAFIAAILAGARPEFSMPSVSPSTERPPERRVNRLATRIGE